MSDLEQRVKELEAKVKILEETLETLKNMQLSEEMEGYIQSKTKSLKLVSLMNTISGQPELDFSEEEKSVRKVQTAKNSIDKQIKAALRNSTVFSEQYPDDPRYFNYEVESGMVTDYSGRQVKDSSLSRYVGKGVRITSYNGFDTKKVIVPAKIDGKPVISIGEKAFQNANFSEIILPSSVKVILESAFQGCTNLRHIDLPEELEYLGSFCFTRSGLEAVCIPDVIKEIPSYCFSDCKNMKNVILGNRIEVLGSRVFSGCIKLNKISLPEAVRVIKNGCFEGTSIETLIVPSSVNKVSNEAFNTSFQFRYSINVTCVFLGRETEISDGRFNGVNQIYCLPGSNAQKFAREHSIAIKPLSEFDLDEI